MSYEHSEDALVETATLNRYWKMAGDHCLEEKKVAEETLTKLKEEKL